MAAQTRLVSTSNIFIAGPASAAAFDAARAYPAVDSARLEFPKRGGFVGALEAIRAAMGPATPRQAIAKSLVWRVWSERYLGERLFESVWGEPARFVHHTGGIYEERLSIEPQTLDATLPIGGRAVWLSERARHEAVALMTLHGLQGRFERVEWSGDGAGYSAGTQ